MVIYIREKYISIVFYEGISAVNIKFVRVFVINIIDSVYEHNIND